MKIQFSSWYAWTDREHIPSIEQSGVYIVARRVKRHIKPDLCSSKIIYIGYTEKPLLSRLEKFDSACGGKGGHAGGNSFFRTRICPELQGRIDELRSTEGLNQKDASKQARSELHIKKCMPDFAKAWRREMKSLSVAAWVPSASWKKNLSGLPAREQLKFVEAKLQVDFVRKNKRLPKYNKTFG